MTEVAPQGRRRRAERLASGYLLDGPAAHDRFAAVVLCQGQIEFISGPTIGELLGRGELQALVDLDYDRPQTR